MIDTGMIRVRDTGMIRVRIGIRPNACSVLRLTVRVR